MGAPRKACEISSFSHQVKGNMAVIARTKGGMPSIGKVNPEKVIPIIMYALPTDNDKRIFLVTATNIKPSIW